MTILDKAQVDQYRREGYLVVPGLFTAGEVAAFQDAAARHQPKQPGSYSASLFAIPGLQDLWHDERLINVAAELLGGDIAFFAQNDYSRYVFTEGEHITGRHAHHDAKGTHAHLFNRLHEAQATPYPVLRFGIYFQNYTTASGGLKVSPGSHLMDSSFFDETKLPYLNVSTRPGDVVCFCARVIHSPFALRSRTAPHSAVSPKEEDRFFARDPGAFEPGPLLRETIFLDFAAPSESADLLIKNRALSNADKINGIAGAIDSLRLEYWADRYGISLRLDFAVVELVLKIAAASRRNDAPAVELLLRALKKACVLSRPWSEHFPLFDKIPEGDDLETLTLFGHKIKKNIMRYGEALPTGGKDPHMGAFTRDALRDLATTPARPA